jgi:hypothetical protein
LLSNDCQELRQDDPASSTALTLDFAAKDSGGFVLALHTGNRFFSFKAVSVCCYDTVLYPRTHADFLSHIHAYWYLRGMTCDIERAKVEAKGMLGTVMGCTLSSLEIR